MSLKVFAKNTFIYSIGNIVIRASTFLLIPIYTHYLSISEYGLLSTLLITSQILIMVIDFGMMPTLIRFSDSYLKSNTIGVLLGSIIFINIISGFITSIIGLYALDLILSYSFALKESTLYASLVVLSSVFQCYSLNLLTYFRAVNRARFFIFSSIALTFLYLILTVVFVIKLNWGLIGILSAQILSYGLFLFFLFFSITLNTKLGYSFKIVKQSVAFGFPLIFARGGDVLLDASILYFIGYHLSLNDSGIYALASKIASILLVLLITPFQLSYEPFIYSQLDNQNLAGNISKIFTYLVLIFVLFAILLLMIFKYFIFLIAPVEYSDAYTLIFFILPIYLFRGINSISQSLIHINGKTSITGSVVSLTTITSIFLGYYTIKLWGIYAAITVINFYWLLIMIILYVFGEKYFPIKLETIRIVILLFIYIFFNLVIFYVNLSGFLFYFSISLLLIVTFSILLKFNFFTDSELSLFKNFIKKFTQSKPKYL